MNKYHHTSIAIKKDHRCEECGKRIPIGARYWVSKDGGWREHTNCENFKTEQDLPPGYNQNRTA